VENQTEPVHTYLGVFAGLLLLTGLTVGVSYLELGAWHAATGLIIAGVKATLVALFFMHLLRAGRLLWLVAGAALFWLGILLALTFSDYLTRHWLEGASASHQSIAPQGHSRP
jgi:cytochrome c oxidase subunit 4